MREREAGRERDAERTAIKLLYYNKSALYNFPIALTDARNESLFMA